MNNIPLELRLWRWQRTSALILLPLVAFHILYQYFFADPHAITYGLVSARLNLLLFLAIDILLLLSVLTHAFLGLRSILMDYAPSAVFARRGTLVILALLGITILYGVSALFAFV